MNPIELNNDKKEHVAILFNKSKKKLDLFMQDETTMVIFDSMADAYIKLKSLFIGKENPPPIFIMDAYHFFRKADHLMHYVMYPATVNSGDDVVFNAMHKLSFKPGNDGNSLAALPSISHLKMRLDDPKTSSDTLLKIAKIIEEGDVEICVSCSTPCMLPSHTTFKNIPKNLDSHIFHCVPCVAKKLISFIEVQGSLGRVNMLPQLARLKKELSANSNLLTETVQIAGSEFVKQLSCNTKAKVIQNVDITKTPWMN